MLVHGPVAMWSTSLPTNVVLGIQVASSTTPPLRLTNETRAGRRKTTHKVTQRTERKEVIDPELYHQLWKQEHGEQVRTAARRQAIRDARLTRVAGRFWESKGPTSTHTNWLTLLGERILQIRKHWTMSRPTQHSVGESHQCQTDHII